MNVRLNAPANATGHYVWARLHSGNANTGSSTFSGGIGKVSSVRYWEIGYIQGGGTSATMNFYGFGPSYGTNDGVAAGNIDLRVAYSPNGRATWINNGPTTHTTSLATPPATILGDSLSPAITLNTGNSVHVALARVTGTTTNSLDNPGTSVHGGATPTTFVLEQNYPNPFNPSTTVRFSVPERSSVTLKVFDLLGREIALLVRGELSFG